MLVYVVVFMIVVMVVIMVMVVIVVVIMVVIVVMVPPADCSCLCLALSDQSGCRRPGAFLPCRTRLFQAAVLTLVSFIRFHHELGAVHRRGADPLSRCHHCSHCGLLVVRVVVAVLIFGDL